MSGYKPTKQPHLAQVPSATRDPMAKVASSIKQANVVNNLDNSQSAQRAATTKRIADALLQRLNARRS